MSSLPSVLYVAGIGFAIAGVLCGVCNRSKTYRTMWIVLSIGVSLIAASFYINRAKSHGVSTVKVFEVPRLEVRSLGPQTGVIVSAYHSTTLMGAGVLLVTVRLDPPILGLPDVVGAITSTSGPRREGEKVTIVFKSYGLANEAVSNDTSPPDGGWYVQ